MHYYQFNIGDYASHTQHLSAIEDLAFRRMMDWCYLNEKPLPLDVDLIARYIRMQEHCNCIASVLQEFWTETKAGYKQPRIEKELKSYKSLSNKRSKAAKARWASNDKGLRGEAHGMQVHSKSNAKQETRNKKHKPLTSNKENLRSRSLVDDLSDKDWVGC